MKVRALSSSLTSSSATNHPRAGKVLSALMKMEILPRGKRSNASDKERERESALCGGLCPRSERFSRFLLKSVLSFLSLSQRNENNFVSLSLSLLSSVTRSENTREREVIVMGFRRGVGKADSTRTRTRTSLATRQRRGGVVVMVILTMMTLLLSSSSLWCLSAVAIRPMDDEKRQCVNTKQGLHHITDDNGYTCDWFDVFPPTGCCPPEKAIEKRYGCSACDLAKGGETEKCCGTYESCVSCCQNAKVSSAETDRTREPIGRMQPQTGYFSDAFSHCKSKCRTQPTVTVHESTYGYEKRFCFGTFPRDKDPTPPRGFKPK